MKNTVSIKKELKKIEAMKKDPANEKNWDFMGGVQQALSWVLEPKNTMIPSAYVNIGKKARS